MDNAIKRERLAVLLSTPEGRAKIAASMAVPRRCGGCDYINGEQFYRVSGRLVPSEVYKQGLDATKAYLESHTS